MPSVPRSFVVLAVLLLVLTVHGWLILGPAHLWQSAHRWAPAAVQTVQASWIPQPAIPVPTAASAALPKPTPATKPRPQRRAKKAVAPVLPAAHTAVHALQSPHDLQPPAKPEATEAPPAQPLAEMVSPALPSQDASTPPPASDGLAPPAAVAAHGPALQLYSATGQALPLQMASDGAALPQQLLLRFKVHGVIKEAIYHAHAELHWQTDGQRYQARQSISAFLLGSLEQNSSGLITPQGLQPQLFVDRRLTRKRTVHWDWANHQATFEPERPPVPIGTGAQDRLSVYLQLAAMLQTMPALRSEGSRLDIPTLGSRNLQMWSFVVQAPQLLQVPAGLLPTLRLLRLPQAGDTDKAQLWVDPERGYVPVRIRIEEDNGDVMDMALKP